MTVKLKMRYAGPLGNYGPGAEIPLPDEQAEALINGGFATEVKAKPKTEAEREPEKKEAEKAEAGPEETATAPPTRRRKPQNK